MKKIIFIALLLIAFTSCKDEKKSGNEEVTISGEARTAKQSDGLTLLKGEFVYYADAAVLQTHREIYGVVIDDKMHELEERAKTFKKRATDMVRVEIRGKIIPKPEEEEGWPFRVEIKEVLNVSQSKENEVIKVGGQGEN